MSYILFPFETRLRFNRYWMQLALRFIKQTLFLQTLILHFTEEMAITQLPWFLQDYTDCNSQVQN